MPLRLCDQFACCAAMLTHPRIFERLIFRCPRSPWIAPALCRIASTPRSTATLSWRQHPKGVKDNSPGLARLSFPRAYPGDGTSPKKPFPFSTLLRRVSDGAEWKRGDKTAHDRSRVPAVYKGSILTGWQPFLAQTMLSFAWA